ncbi:MAG: hypothetical protein QOD98_1175 [Nocardioidaceae bacterium]|nr:hypothetical protein [Nocardioidaceae bacterium]
MPRCHGGVATTVAALTALLAVVAAPANALPAHPKKTSTSPYFYIGHAGGTQVQALGTSIRSDLTGASGVEGYTFPAHDDNRAAGVNLGSGLVKVGAVTTWADAVPVPHGTRTITGARTDDLSVLGGLIKADVVETVTTATKTPDGVSSTSSTKYIGLTIAGQEYPVNLPKDFNITIPGIAAVVANSSTQYTLAGGTYITGFGLYVGLLKPFKDVPATATVLLNPTQSIVVPAPPPAAPQIGGIGYSTLIKANVGPALDVDAGPSAFVSTPPGGTQGETIQNATAEVTVPNVLHVATAKSWTTGKTVPRHGKVKVNNELTGLNVLNGLITADAISAGVVVKKKQSSKVTTRLGSELLNLTIAGNGFPANVPPNTKLDLAGVGTLVLNEQVTAGWGGYVRALHLTLTTAQYGLPVGAEIEVGVALGWAANG